jgi:hypothetical protein
VGWEACRPCPGGTSAGPSCPRWRSASMSSKKIATFSMAFLRPRSNCGGWLALYVDRKTEEASLTECTLQPSNDDAAGAIVCGGLDPIVNVEDEFRHIVVPIEPDHCLGRQTAATGAVEKRRHPG